MKDDEREDNVKHEKGIGRDDHIEPKAVKRWLLDVEADLVRQVNGEE